MNASGATAPASAPAPAPVRTRRAQRHDAPEAVAPSPSRAPSPVPAAPGPHAVRPGVPRPAAPRAQAPRPFTPRPSQQEVLEYRRGLMGIAAVPGSGKTETVAMLVDRILDLQVLRGDQEILVVTLVNAACDNLSRRVDAAAAARVLMPGVGYRVRTLHALAGDVLRERPEAVGVTEALRIVDQDQCDRIRRQVAAAWLRGNRHRCEWLLDAELAPERRAFVLRERMPELIEGLAEAFIRYAKGERVTPDRLQGLLRDRGGDDETAGLAEIGASLYADYQRALSYRGALDFDDLIWRALDLLESDPALLGRLRERWPYILEDEAQDSSAVQERILERLAGEQGNWVRVGDPNQAIFETFTTADPKFLRAFLRRGGVTARELPDSGRSAPRIIAAANRMIDWTAGCHPVAGARDALGPPHVRPTPPGDPQPNPSDRQARVAFHDKPFSPEREAAEVANSLARFLPTNPQATVAVLAPSNHRAADLAQAIRGRGLRCVESLLSGGAGSTQAVADALGRALRSLADPDSAYALADCYVAWRRQDRDREAAWKVAQSCASRLRRCEALEDYLWPRLGRAWLERQEIDAAERERLARFAVLVRRWQGAAALPIDQLVLTISQDLFDQPDELAVAFRLAVVLRRSAHEHPRWGIRELIDDLTAVAGNRRRFAAFAPDQAGFDPAAHRGAVVVATMHKAKGLEWDRVYLTSVNAYDFPADPDADRFIGEKWYMQDRLNADAEACEEARCLLAGADYRRGKATYGARVDYIRERLRLLFVGLTRARRELIVTWNTGRKGDVRAAAAFSALAAWWQTEQEKQGS